MALTSPEDRLRHQLDLLYSEVALEVRHRTGAGKRPRKGTPREGGGRLRPSVQVPSVIRNLQAEAPALALQGLESLALKLRRLTGRDVIDLATMMEIVQFISTQRELGRRGPNFTVDDFGFDQEWTESLLPVFRWIYHNYWRVDTTGIENVPASGGALLVSNHAGVLPWDGAMIKTAIFEEHPNPRHARALIAQFFFQLPFLSWFLRRTGQTVGHPDDTLRLLERDELVLVFPEGVKGTGKPFSERYQLKRFGRGGYVKLAVRLKIPIVPVAIVGAEESMPLLGRVPAALFGVPYLPITLPPLPAKWHIRFGPPIDLSDAPANAEEDLAWVSRTNERTRQTVEGMITAILRARTSVF